MAEFKLKASAPLGNYAADFEGTTLHEVSNLAIISIAVPQGGRAGLQRKVAAAFERRNIPKCSGSEATHPMHASDGPHLRHAGISSVTLLI